MNKFYKFLSVVVLGGALVGCQSDPSLADDFAVGEGGNLLETEEIIFEDVPGSEGGIGSLPDNPAGNFTPLGDEMQIWPNVYFSRNQYTLGTVAERKLDKLAEYLLANTQYAIVINGHCSVRGSEEYNRVLSEKRAQVSKDYLVAAGVAPSRINTVAFGEEQPAIAGENEEAHAKNRRDEFIIGTRD